MQSIQPRDVFDPGTYAQCVRSGKTIYISGQAAQDRDGKIVGAGDVTAQAERVWRQIGSLLEAAGANYRKIVKVTTYLVDMADREVSMSVRKKYLGDHVAASTLVGTPALAQPEMLIEVEVIAELD